MALRMMKKWRPNFLDKLPLYLLLISLILLGSRTYEEAQSTPLSLEGINRILGILGSIFLSFIYLYRTKAFLRVPSILFFLLCYCIICINSSLLFSEWPLYSLWKVCELLAVFFVGLYVYSRSRFNFIWAQDYYEVVLNFFRLLLIVTIIGAILYPADAWRSPVGEATIAAYGAPLLPFQIFGVIFRINPNSLGGIAACLLIIHLIRLYYFSTGKYFNFLFIFLSLFVLVFAQSRTAWIGLSITIILIIVFTDTFGRFFKYLIGLSIFGLVNLSWTFIFDYLTRGVSTEQLQGMSGRSSWWEIAISKFMEESFAMQLFGMGFATANRTVVSEELGRSVTTLHSDYMDTLISTGFSGTLLLLIMIATIWKRVWTISRAEPIFFAEMLGVISIITVRSASGTTFAIYNHFLLLGIIMAVFAQVISNSRSKLLSNSDNSQ